MSQTCERCGGPERQGQVYPVRRYGLRAVSVPRSSGLLHGSSQETLSRVHETMKPAVALLILAGCHAPQAARATSSRTRPDASKLVQCMTGPGKPWEYRLLKCEDIVVDELIDPLTGGVCWYRDCGPQDRDGDDDVDLVDVSVFTVKGK